MALAEVGEGSGCTRSPLAPFSTPFLGGRVPRLKSTTEKVGTLILASLQEDLA